MGWTHFVFLLVLAADGSEQPSSALPATFHTRARFAAALDQPLDATWKGVSLRSVLRQLARERKIAILLDRRIDPDQVLDLDTGSQKFLAVIEKVAAAANAAGTRVGNNLVVAPQPAAHRLRTLVLLREQELRSTELNLPAARLRELQTRRETIAWKDFDRPVDILGQIGRRFGMSIAGLDRIPHDLWAGAAMPESTVSESLSMTLNQFDLSFRWTDRGRCVEIVDAPATAAIERAYRVPGNTLDTTLRELKAFDAAIESERRDDALVLRGTIEAQEWMASRLNGKTAARKNEPKPAMPLERQSFSLRVEGVTLRDLLAELNQRDVPLRYDADALKAAGIDLDRKVSLAVTKLPARAFFKKLLDPFELQFRFERGDVVIEPRSSAPRP